MRLLLLLLVPFASFSQIEKTITYKVKYVHNVAVKTDNSITWTVDTISYHVPFDIKLTKKSVSIDGYGTYKIAEYQLRGEPGELQYPWYKFTNGIYLWWVNKIAIMEYPLSEKKAKTIVFDID